jgi:hypothetical protein
MTFYYYFILICLFVCVINAEDTESKHSVSSINRNHSISLLSKSSRSSANETPKLNNGDLTRRHHHHHHHDSYGEENNVGGPNARLSSSSGGGGGGVRVGGGESNRTDKNNKFHSNNLDNTSGLSNKSLSLVNNSDELFLVNRFRNKMKNNNNNNKSDGRISLNDSSSISNSILNESDSISTIMKIRQMPFKMAAAAEAVAAIGNENDLLKPKHALKTHFSPRSSLRIKIIDETDTDN